MDDALKDLGLKYAGSLPLAIASVLAPLIVLAWLAFKAKELDASWRGPVWFGLAVLAVGFLVQAPTAYTKAKADCRQEFQHAGGKYQFGSEVPVSYRFSKCFNVWPHGPDYPGG